MSPRPGRIPLPWRPKSARRSIYRWDGVAMRREWEYLVLAPEALVARLGEPLILLGDAAPAIRSLHARPAPPRHRGPSPAWVALLGAERLRARETMAPADLVPIYLRPSEAELKRRAVLVR